MDAQPLDTPLWDFALAVYGSDGVADECLALQDRLGLDVNVLLLTTYIGVVERIPLTSADITAANAVVAGWHGEVVRPLRAVRKALKAFGQEALRAQVKAAELQAEKIELAVLWQWSQTLADRPRDGGTLAGSLAALLALHQAPDPPDAVLPRLMAAASAYRT